MFEGQDWSNGKSEDSSIGCHMIGQSDVTLALGCRLFFRLYDEVGHPMDKEDEDDEMDRDHEGN